jgi:hypothetical protein
MSLLFIAGLDNIASKAATNVGGCPNAFDIAGPPLSVVTRFEQIPIT